MSYRAEIEQMLRRMPSDWKQQWANARAQLQALEYDAPVQPDVGAALSALYLTAGGNESGDRVKGPISVPAHVRDEAMRGLRMAYKNNYGAWNFIGIARAIQLAVVPSIARKSVDRMRNFFSRHEKDANARGFGDDRNPSRGYLAHLVWGGDPAREWVNRRANPKKLPEKQTNTEAFRRWFGDSKVVDRYKRPLVVYHGTASEFWAFDPSTQGRATDAGTLGAGFYFTSSREAAQSYADDAARKYGGTPRVVEVYLRVSKPYRAPRRLWQLSHEPMEARKHSAALRKQKYDGIQFHVDLSAIGDASFDEYVVFDPRQIKSATDNVGTFNPEDADIRYNPYPAWRRK